MAELSNEVSQQISDSTEIQGSVESLNVDKVSSIISSQRGASSESIRLDVERDLRSQISTEQKNIEKTAISTIRSSTTKVRSEQNIENTIRLRPSSEGSGSGIKSGRTRSDSEDAANLNKRVDINNVVISSSRDSADINRARSKLQRRCNHIFNISTRVCQFCQKHRDSHV